MPANSTLITELAQAPTEIAMIKILTMKFAVVFAIFAIAPLFVYILVSIFDKNINTNSGSWTVTLIWMFLISSLLLILTLAIPVLPDLLFGVFQ